MRGKDATMDAASLRCTRGDTPRSPSPLHCGCGRWHADASRLVKLGWQELGGGEFAMLARCPCGSKLTAARIADASKCDVCRRVVTGSEGDVKVYVADDRGARVVCAACFRRDAPPAPWVLGAQ